MARQASTVAVTFFKDDDRSGRIRFTGAWDEESITKVRNRLDYMWRVDSTGIYTHEGMLVITKGDIDKQIVTIAQAIASTLGGSRLELKIGDTTTLYIKRRKLVKTYWDEPILQPVTTPVLAA